MARSGRDWQLFLQRQSNNNLPHALSANWTATFIFCRIFLRPIAEVAIGAADLSLRVRPHIPGDIRQTWCGIPSEDNGYSPSHRKPIYEDEPSVVPAERPQSEPHSQPQSQLQERDTQQSLLPARTLRRASSTSTADVLAQQVRQARLFLYAHTLTAENSFNDALARVLHAESRFTNTIASLAPPRESGERLLPGSIYVLVSSMAGSIVSRNRGIFLRATTPLAVGTVAAWTLLPVTMQNVSDLVFEFEKKIPGVAEQHVRIRTATEESWNTAKAHSAHARGLLENKIGQGRGKLEEWVRKGN
ncbi:hypothetical protein GX50_00449 [[Emmonsia] crescens]|uniref:MICOS complex subunit n=1 Tax=[Emmonsia] crescens TaxID=73230 RepID=A0A2B7ZUB4_9EURO|nr:hypothetical protein GX50_00449 [Emmonsia crescens]